MDLHLQPPANAQERATLARFNAKPEIRLACQLRPTRDIAVFPIFASAPTAPTAIGDGINVASRLEGAAKEFDAEAVISCDLARKAGIDIAAYEQQRIYVRGRIAPVEALVVREAFDLAGATPMPELQPELFPKTRPNAMRRPKRPIVS